APARQATMRGAIEWSWKLLSPSEQQALAQLSIFRGGFSAEAAERVLGVSRSGEAIDLVQSLREKSLLRGFEPPGLPGELRFGIYECIRELAAEKLAALGQAAETEARHAAWMLQQGDEWAGFAETHDGADVLTRITLESDNL